MGEYHTCDKLKKATGKLLIALLTGRYSSVPRARFFSSERCVREISHML